MTEITVSMAVQSESFMAALTPREREVAGHMAEARSNAEIAERMWVSISNITNCVSVIYEELKRAITCTSSGRTDSETVAPTSRVRARLLPESR